ncbi:hypothetical protein [Streptomyces sp. NPDC059479]|uniref:hypothetical protein n=1 Tax=Streptomyces sp. NPDC059479 TaxID=3346848 RepID=UPI0036966B61
MAVEVRLSTPDRLDEVLGLPVDAVSIGQEGCVANLPGTAALREAADRIRAAGLRAGVVLPAAWQRHSARLADLAATLVGDGPLTLTVNDLGTLATLASAPVPGRELAIGLALVPGRPYDAGDTSRIPLEPALYDNAFLREVEVFGVRTVEAEAAAVVAEREGLRVRRLADVIPLAWARSCPTARQHGLAPPDCTAACDTPTTMVATHRWQLGHGHREPIPVGDRSRQEPLTVYGNAVYSAATATTTATPTDGDVILDARFYTPEALAERIGGLRPRTASASFQESLHG